MKRPRTPESVRRIECRISERVNRHPFAEKTLAFLYPYRWLLFWTFVVVAITVIGANIQEYPIYNEVTLVLIGASSLAAIIVMLIGTNEWTTRGIGIFFNKWGALILFGAAWLALRGWGDGIGKWERSALRSCYIVGSLLFLYGVLQFLRETLEYGRWYIRRRKE
jgi:hypothetical protein